MPTAPPSSRHGSRSQGARPAPHPSRRPSPDETKDRTNEVVKKSLMFLGAVGAATLVAHKYWPKGMLYSDKEEEEKKEAEQKEEEKKEEGEEKKKNKGPPSDDNKARSQKTSQASGSGRSRHADAPAGRETDHFVHETAYRPPRPRYHDDGRRLVEVSRHEYLDDVAPRPQPRTRVYVDDYELIGRPRVMANGTVRHEYDYV